MASVDESSSTVMLPGATKLEPRRVALDSWGLNQLKRRAEQLESHTAPLVYCGDASEQSAQASMCRTLEIVFHYASIDDPGVRPASVRAWLGGKVFASTGRIDAVAAQLGLRSLDAAARLIGLTSERWGQ